MRIIINIGLCRDKSTSKRAFHIRTGYQLSSSDQMRVQNAGIEIYNLMKDGLDGSVLDAVVEHEGERR